MGSHQNARSPTMSNGGMTYDKCVKFLNDNKDKAPQLRPEDTFKDCDVPRLNACYLELMSVISCLLALNREKTLAGVWPGHNKDDYVTYNQFFNLKKMGKHFGVWKKETIFTASCGGDPREACKVLLLVSNILYMKNKELVCEPAPAGLKALTDGSPSSLALSVWMPKAHSESSLPSRSTLADYNIQETTGEEPIRQFVFRLCANLLAYLLITTWLATWDYNSGWFEPFYPLGLVRFNNLQWWFLQFLGCQSGLIFAVADCVPFVCQINYPFMWMGEMACGEGNQRRAFRCCNAWVSGLYCFWTFGRCENVLQSIRFAVFIIFIYGTTMAADEISESFADADSNQSSWIRDFICLFYKKVLFAKRNGVVNGIVAGVVWYMFSSLSEQLAFFVAVVLRFVIGNTWASVCATGSHIVLQLWTNLRPFPDKVFRPATAADPSECVQLGKYLAELAAVENGLWSCSVHYSTAIKQQLGTCNAVVARRPKKVDCPGLWFSSSSTVDVDYGDEHTNYTTVVPERDCTDAVQGYKQLEQHPLHQAVVNKTLTCKELANATKTLTIVDFLHGQLTE